MTTNTDGLSEYALYARLAKAATELAETARARIAPSHGTDLQTFLKLISRDALIEAIADVNVAADALRRKLGITADEIADVEAAKIERWRRRLSDAAGTENR